MLAPDVKSLSEKHRAKAFWTIELLKEYGTTLREPYTKSLTGEQYRGLRELRIKFAGITDVYCYERLWFN